MSPQATSRAGTPNYYDIDELKYRQALRRLKKAKKNLVQSMPSC